MSNFSDILILTDQMALQNWFTLPRFKIIPEQFTVKAHPAVFEGEEGGGGGGAKK